MYFHLILSQVFNHIKDEKAALVMFPGTEAQFGTAYDAMREGGLEVRHIMWDKGYSGGVTGARLNYNTEHILLGYTQPPVRSHLVLFDFHKCSSSCR